MRLVLAGTVIAEEGDGFTDIINLSPLSRTGSSESIRLIGSRSVFFKDNKNSEYGLRARVPYFCDSWESAMKKVAELSALVDGLGGGDFFAEFDSWKLRLACAVVDARFPDEIDGSFFEVEYEFRGGSPACINLQ